jgi:hypothetical protein
MRHTGTVETAMAAEECRAIANGIERLDHFGSTDTASVNFHGKLFPL